MTELRLPYNAEQILDLRKKGKRPADMLLVSMIGWLGELNPCVIAQPGRDYDWRFLRGLAVLLVVDASIDKLAVKSAVEKILEQQPEYLGVWFGDKQAGLHVAWGTYRPKSKAAKVMSFFDKQKYSNLGVKKK